MFSFKQPCNVKKKEFNLIGSNEMNAACTASIKTSTSWLASCSREFHLPDCNTPKNDRSLIFKSGLFAGFLVIQISHSSSVVAATKGAKSEPKCVEALSCCRCIFKNHETSIQLFCHWE
jgi:hypothetical protein